ncbi:MAG: PQQ-binding-like beta-propeller repeat protein [Myxococcota bacterium]
MTVLRALGLGLALTGLGCDGVNTVANPEVPLWVHHPGSALSIHGRRPLTSPSLKLGEPYEKGRPAIDVAHRRLFVGSRDHGLYSLDASDLSIRWRFETAGAVQSEPLYNLKEDAVYFGSNDGALYKLRAVDGSMQWRFASNAQVRRPPILHQGRLFFVNANDTLIALDPKTGKLLWYQHREPAAGMEISGYAGVAAIDERVYTSFSDGVVMAYRTDNGAEAWNAPVDLSADAQQVRDEDLRYFDADATPVPGLAEGRPVIYVASYEGGVYALDASTGEQVWSNDAAIGVSDLVLWDAPARPREGEPPGARRHRVLLASSGLTGITGLDPDAGSELWRRDVPSGGVTRPEPWSGVLLVGTTRYGLFLMHPLDGSVIDGVYHGGSFAADPVAYGKRAFIMSNDGNLYGLSVKPPRRLDPFFRTARP